MDDRNREGHGDHGEERRDGPPETQWLALEMSKVIASNADELARRAGEELLKEAIKARLKERLGARIEAVATLVADALVDDLEANLEIEGRIAARRDARRGLDGRIAEALGLRQAPPAEGTAEGGDPRQA